MCLLFEDSKASRHLVTYSIDVKERELIEGPWSQTNVEFGARILVPVPTIYGGGVLLIGESTITYLGHNRRSEFSSFSTTSSAHFQRGQASSLQNNSNAIYQTSIGISRSHITSYCFIEGDGPCRFLLGDQYGNIRLLILHSDQDNLPSLVIEHLGITSIPETLSYLGSGILFIGSCFGDSQLVKLHTEPQPQFNDTLIEVLETYTNIGPILDFCFIRNGTVGQV